MKMLASEVSLIALVSSIMISNGVSADGESIDAQGQPGWGRSVSASISDLQLQDLLLVKMNDLNCPIVYHETSPILENDNQKESYIQDYR